MLFPEKRVIIAVSTGENYGLNPVNQVSFHLTALETLVRAVVKPQRIAMHMCM